MIFYTNCKDKGEVCQVFKHIWEDYRFYIKFTISFLSGFGKRVSKLK